MVTVNDIFAISFLNWYYMDEVPDTKDFCELLDAISECPWDFDLTMDDVMIAYTEKAGIDLEMANCTYVGWLLGKD